MAKADTLSTQFLTHGTCPHNHNGQNTISNTLLRMRRLLIFQS